MPKSVQKRSESLWAGCGYLAGYFGLGLAKLWAQIRFESEDSRPDPLTKIGALLAQPSSEACILLVLLHPQTEPARPATINTVILRSNAAGPKQMKLGPTSL